MTKTLTFQNNRHLIIPIAVSASGKSTVARTYFNEHEIWGLDKIRLMLNGAHCWESMALSKVAAKTLHHMVETQMRNDVLVYLDNTNLKVKYLRPYIKLAHQYGYKIHIVKFKTPIEECIARDTARENSVGADVINSQTKQLENINWNQIVHSVDTVFDEPPKIVRAPEKTVVCSKAVFTADIQGMLDKFKSTLSRYDSGYKVIVAGDIPDRGTHDAETLIHCKDLYDNGVLEAVAGNHDLGVLKCIRTSGGSKKNQMSSQSLKTYHELTEKYPHRVDEIATWIENMPRVILVKTDNGEFLVSHFGIYFYEDRIEGSEFHPNMYEARGCLRGNYTGRMTKSGYKEIDKPWERADNKWTHYTVVYGHNNQSDPLQVPFVNGMHICMESHCETTDNDLCMMSCKEIMEALQ